MDYRRRLPHIYRPGCPAFITFRLHGSLPANRDFSPANVISGQAFVAMDRILDQAATGPRFLSMPRIANVVADAIRSQRGFEAHSWVVMPNHVHLLITPYEDCAEPIRLLKGSTSREANLLLSRTGVPFWQSESYDHIVRDDREFHRIAGYIENNPICAGLANTPEEFCWSSAAGTSLSVARRKRVSCGVDPST
ncbi:MAG: transposase [Bryobacteraceae bacterium]